jgi:hypothetical protein
MRNRLSEPKARALLAFAVTVALALLMRWEAGDLMWGIWASSATYGFVYGVVLMKFNPEEADAGDGSERGRFFGVLAFFVFAFGLPHYAQGFFLSMLFPITETEGWDSLLFPFTALAWYWGVVATTFYSRWPELMEATHPSEELHRLLKPFKNIAPMQVLIFLLMFLTAARLIRFAVYPVLIFYFFPFPVFREKLKYWWDKLDERMNTPPPSEFDEIDEFEDLDEFDES